MARLGRVVSESDVLGNESGLPPDGERLPDEERPTPPPEDYDYEGPDPEDDQRGDRSDEDQGT
jgi:hypothetical protein